MSLTVALPMEALASTGQHRALATPAARRPRSLRGLQAAQALVKALSTTELNDSKMWHGAAGPMWYANPCTAGCSKAAVATTHVYARHVYTAAKVDLIKMTCDNWQCWVATVVDCYSDRCARAADELCLVIKWGEWAMVGIATLQSLNYAAKATTKTKSTVLKNGRKFCQCMCSVQKGDISQRWDLIRKHVSDKVTFATATCIPAMLTVLLPLN